MSRDNNIDNIFRDGLKNMRPAISEESRRQLQRRVFFLKFVRFNNITVQNVITVGAIASIVSIMTWASIFTELAEAETIDDYNKTEQTVAKKSSENEIIEKPTSTQTPTQTETNQTEKSGNTTIEEQPTELSQKETFDITKGEILGEKEKSIIKEEKQETISQPTTTTTEEKKSILEPVVKQQKEKSDITLISNIDKKEETTIKSADINILDEKKQEYLLPLSENSQSVAFRNSLFDLPKRSNSVLTNSSKKDELTFVEVSPSIMNGFISLDNRTYKARKYFKLGLPLPGIFKDEPEKYKQTRTYKNQWKSAKKVDHKKQASQRKKFVNRKKLAAKSQNSIISSKLVEKDKNPVRLFDIGLAFSPEWMFNAIDSDSKTAYNIDMKLSYQHEKLIIQSGLSLGFNEGTNNFDIQYQQFLGTYQQLDSITFYVDPANGNVSPIYHTSEATIFDSVPNNISTAITKKYTYLRLPVLVGYEFALSEKWSIVPKVGAIISFNLETEMPSTIWNPGVNHINYTNQTTASRKSTSWQLHVSMAFRHNLSKKFLIELEPYFRQSVGKTYDENNSSITNPYSVGIGVGIIYRFNLKPEKP